MPSATNIDFYTPDRVAALYRKAAQLIRDEGWVQKAVHIPREGRCAYGAIKRAVDLYTGVDITNRAHLRAHILAPLAEHVQSQVEPPLWKIGFDPETSTVARWNDRVACDRHEVQAALLTVAAELDGWPMPPAAAEERAEYVAVPG